MRYILPPFAVAVHPLIYRQVIYLIYPLRNKLNNNFYIVLFRWRVITSLGIIVFWVLLFCQIAILAVGTWVLTSREVQIVFSVATCSHLNFFIVTVQFFLAQYLQQDGERSPSATVLRLYMRVAYIWPMIGFLSLFFSLLLLVLEATGKKTYLPASWQCLIIFIKTLTIWLMTCKGDKGTRELILNAESQRGDDIEPGQGGVDVGISPLKPVGTSIVV